MIYGCCVLCGATDRPITQKWLIRPVSSIDYYHGWGSISICDNCDNSLPKRPHVADKVEYENNIRNEIVKFLEECDASSIHFLPTYDNISQRLSDLGYLSHQRRPFTANTIYNYMRKFNINREDYISKKDKTSSRYRRDRSMTDVNTQLARPVTHGTLQGAANANTVLPASTVLMSDPPLLPHENDAQISRGEEPAFDLIEPGSEPVEMVEIDFLETPAF